RSQATHQPIIVTQKGYPAGVLLDVELFTALRELAERYEAERNGKSESTSAE
ncbi:type II toxin-antitoxin system prevent-host-death family antitoxin, partial [Chloroflexus sp.]